MNRFLLTLLLVCGAMAAAADTFTVGNFTYATQSATEVQCTGLSAAGASLTSITIPGRVTYGGKEYYVEGIADRAFAGNTTLRQVRLGFGIRQVLTRAFYGCTALQYVWLPSSTQALYSQCFMNCSAMLQFQLAGAPPALYATNCFTGMRQCDVVTALRSNLDAYNGNSSWTAIDSDGKVSANGSAANDFINGGCWIYTTDYTTASYSAKVTLVGVGNATYLAMTPNISDPTNRLYGGGSDYVGRWTEVAPYAASGNTTLRTIGRSDLGSNFRLEKVGRNAFYACKALTAVNIAAETIETAAFRDCPNLATVNLYLKDNESTGTQVLGNLAFAGTAVTEQYIPSSLTAYGNGAFARCPNLKTFTVSASNAYFSAIGDSYPYMAGCLFNKAKTTLYQVGGGSEDFGLVHPNPMPNALTTINTYAYAGAPLERVEIPYGVTNIAGWVFDEMPNVNTILIPSSISTVAADAFRGLSTAKFKDLYVNTDDMPDKLNSSTSFTDLAGGVTLHVPRGGTDTWRSRISSVTQFTGVVEDAYDFSAYSGTAGQIYELRYTVSNANPYTDTRVQKSAAAGQMALVGYRFGSPTQFNGAVTIGSTVKLRGKTYIPTEVQRDVFSGETKLTTVSGGTGIKRLGAQAFSGATALTAVDLPNLEQVGDSAFIGCKALKSVTLGSSLAAVGRRAFGGCAALTGELELPASLATIGAYAFDGTSLTGMTLWRTGTTTIGTRFFPVNSGFRCWVPLNQFYTLRTQVAAWTGGAGLETAVQPYLRPTTEWTAFSCYLPLQLPIGPEFYTATKDYSREFMTTTALPTGNVDAVAAGTGLLVKGIPGYVYRLPIATSDGTAPGNNHLHGVTTAMTSVAAGSYLFNTATQRFERVNGTATVPAGWAYLTPTTDYNAPEMGIDQVETDYGIEINRHWITSVNVNDLSVIDGLTGTVTFDPATKTLTLNDAQFRRLWNSMDGLTVRVLGETRIVPSSESMPLYFAANTTLTGGGSLIAGEMGNYSIGSTACLIGDNKTLTINGGTHLTAWGHSGGLSDYPYNDVDGKREFPNLVVSGVDTHVQVGCSGRSGYDYSYDRVRPMLNDGLAFTAPEGVKFNDLYEACFPDGRIVHGEYVVISKPTGQQGLLGDVDGSGTIDVTDLNILINIMLGNAQSSDYPGNADCDGNNLVDVTDLNILINIMLKKE